MELERFGAGNADYSGPVRRSWPNVEKQKIRDNPMQPLTPEKLREAAAAFALLESKYDEPAL